MPHAALSKGDDCSGPDAIYLPEKVFDMDKFMEDIKKLAAEKSSVVIAVSEGVKIADGLVGQHLDRIHRVVAACIEEAFDIMFLHDFKNFLVNIFVSFNLRHLKTTGA